MEWNKDINVFGMKFRNKSIFSYHLLTTGAHLYLPFITDDLTDGNGWNI